MRKKLFVTAAAAIAVSVPLAGVAWADPPTDPGNDGNGIGAGGVPGAVGSQPGLPGTPVPPGKGAEFPDPFPDVVGVSGIAKFDGSVPDAIDANTPFGRIGPGSQVKVFTPGCDKGNGPSPSGVGCL